MLHDSLCGKYLFLSVCKRGLSCLVYFSTLKPKTSKYIQKRQPQLKQRCMCVRVQSFSHVRLFVTLWTVACQAFLSMGFPRQGYWGGLPFLPPGDLPSSRVKLASPALAGGFFLPLSPQGSQRYMCIFIYKQTCVYRYTYTHTHIHTQIYTHPYIHGLPR